MYKLNRTRAAIFDCGTPYMCFHCFFNICKCTCTRLFQGTKIQYVNTTLANVIALHVSHFRIFEIMEFSHVVTRQVIVLSIWKWTSFNVFTFIGRFRCKTFLFRAKKWDLWRHSGYLNLSRLIICLPHFLRRCLWMFFGRFDSLS